MAIGKGGGAPRGRQAVSHERPSWRCRVISAHDMGVGTQGIAHKTYLNNKKGVGGAYLSLDNRKHGVRYLCSLLVPDSKSCDRHSR